MVPLTRRRVLTALGTGAVAGLATGVGSADQPQRVFVRPHGDQSQAERALRDHGGRVLVTYENFAFVAGVIPERNRQGLERDDRVANVERDTRVEAVACSDHPDEVLWWGVDRIDADQVGETGAGVDIAVLDTGLDRDHCDLTDNIQGGHNCTNGPTSNWNDGGGHGSHCGGIAAGVNNAIGVRGVAPGANLYGVKVLGNDGSGYWSWVVCGIDWCLSTGRELLSMSFGADSMPSDVHDAIAEAYDRGHLLVAAAGNAGNDGGCAGNVIQPARHPDVIAVSAVGKNDGIAGYSSTGSEVELAAPGGADSDGDGSREEPEAIYSTYKSNDYEHLFGTSMACPHVTGVAALVAEAYGGMTLEGSTDGSPEDNADVRAALHEAEDLGLASCQQGHGLVDAEAAVASVGDTAPTVSWVTPSDGEEVSGSVTVQIDASDAEDADDTLTVDWRVDGGSWRTATYNAGTGYYEEDWDTTTVDDGEHTLDARAEDSAGNVSTATIAVTTENTDDAPELAWANPQDGEAVSGTVTIQLDANDDRDETGTLDVDWELDDSGNWHDTTYDSGSGYYEGDWDTTAVADGDHTLEARATDSSGNTTTAGPITVTVDNSESAPEITTFEVTTADSPNPHADITVDWAVHDDNGNLASVLVEVHDTDGNLVASDEDAVSGSDASGTDEFQIKFGGGAEYTVTLTASDDAGNSTSDSTTVQAA